MRVVHHQHRVVLAAELQQVGELGDRALHREDAVGDHQLDPAVARRGQLRFQVGEIGVLVDRGLALGDRLGQPDAVDDGGVVQLIADDDVVLAQQRGGHRLVGVPAADEAESEAGGADQPGTGGLERAMHGEGAADEAHRGGAGAEAVERGLARGHHLRLRRSEPR